MINNLNDGMAWGLFPLYFAASGLSLAQVGLLAATYPASGRGASSEPAPCRIGSGARA